MNKVFIGMVLAVCVLGMALLMLNERVARKTDQRETATQTVPKVDIPDFAGRLPPPPADYGQGMRGAQATPGQIAAAVETLENKEARAALAPPLIKPEDVRPVRNPAPAQEAAIKEAPATRDEKLEAASIQLENEAPQLQISQPVERPVQPAPLPRPVAEQPKPQPPAPDQPKLQQPVPSQPRPEAQKPANSARTGGRSIQKFVVYAREKGATVRLAGNTAMSYKSMTLENPNRVVVDLDGDWKFPERLPVPKNDLVNSVRIGKIDNKTRVVIDLKEKPKTSRILPAKTGDGFDVRVDK